MTHIVYTVKCKGKTTSTTEVGIYKRKQESKKIRKHAFDQESDEEKKKKERKHALDQESDQEKTITAKKERKHGLDQESDQEKKKKLSFFLGRECVFFLFFLTFIVFFSS